MGIATISVELRKLIDVELIKIAGINAQIAKDTSVNDKIEYRRQIGVCLKEIKKLDKEFYEEIVPDSKEKH